MVTFFAGDARNRQRPQAEMRQVNSRCEDVERDHVELLGMQTTPILNSCVYGHVELLGIVCKRTPIWNSCVSGHALGS